MPSTTTSRALAASLLLPALLALAACGGSTTGGASSPVTTPTAKYEGPSSAAAGAPSGPAPSSQAASAAASLAVPSQPAAAPVSQAPTGSTALPGVPAVTANATEVMKQPTVAKGTGPVSAALVTRDLVVGAGTAAVPTDTVDVRYNGTLYADGSVFDASWKRGAAPVTFPLARVIPGFAQGILGMKPGGRREIVIPSALGYGAQSPGAGIPPNSDLVFVVDLVKAGASTGG